MGEIPGCSKIENLTLWAANKEKVKKISVGSESVTVLLENNTIFQKGSSNSFHFKNNESKSVFTKTEIWDKESQQNIVDVACGQDFSMVVTESGQVWAWGNEFLDIIDQSSETPIQIKTPVGLLAKRVWAMIE